MTPLGYSYYTRRWLNRPGYHAGAYLIGSVDHTRSVGSLVVTDCTRLIRLEFDAYSPDSRRNSLHKIDVLAKTLTDMRTELGTAKPRRRPSR